MTGAGEHRLRHVDGAPARRAADWAWLAGVIESEGSLRLVNRSTPALEVTNTDPVLLQRCRQITGAGTYRQSGQSRWRECYRWTVTGDRARAVLARVFPYLVTKQEQVSILLDLVKLKNGRRLTDAQRAHRKQVDLRLRALKRLRHPPPVG